MFDGHRRHLSQYAYHVLLSSETAGLLAHTFPAAYQPVFFISNEKINDLYSDFKLSNSSNLPECSRAADPNNNNCRSRIVSLLLGPACVYVTLFHQLGDRNFGSLEGAFQICVEAASRCQRKHLL